jgi:hypothetical protein
MQKKQKAFEMPIPNWSFRAAGELRHSAGSVPVYHTNQMGVMVVRCGAEVNELKLWPQ